MTLKIRLGEHSFQLLEQLAKQLKFKREAIIELALTEYLSKYEFTVENGKIVVIKAERIEPRPRPVENTESI